MKNRIRQLRKQKGLTLQQLAERVGSDKSQINRLERGERRLTTDWLERLAPALECSPADILANSQTLPTISTHLYHTVRGFVVDALHKTGWSLAQLAATTRIGANRLEALVHGTPSDVASPLTEQELERLAEVVQQDFADESLAKDMLEGLAEPPASFEALPLDRGSIPLYQLSELVRPNDPSFYRLTDCPPILRGVKQAYAVIVTTPTMTPRFQPGETLYINPHQPPRPGNDIILTLENHPPILARLNGRSKDTLTTKTFTPAETQTWEQKHVIAVHTVVGCTFRVVAD